MTNLKPKMPRNPIAKAMRITRPKRVPDYERKRLERSQNHDAD